jgi:MFS family permease
VPSTASLLTRNKDFRRLLVADLVLAGGDWFVLIPLVTLLPELTGSGFWGGLVLAADVGLIALLLPYTGTVADRLDRRKIMISANVVGILAVAALLLVRSAGTAWIAVAAVAVFGIAKAFHNPAATSALPNLVDEADLPTANAIAGSVWGTMLVVGASLGGVMASLVGPYVCFLVTLVCLIVAAAFTWGIRRPMQQPRPAGPAPHAFRALREALAYIGSRPRVAALVTVKSAVGLGNGVLVAFPLLATHVYRVGEMGTGMLFAVRGAGAVIGPLLFRFVLKRPRWLLPGLAVSMGVYGLAYLGVSFTTLLAVALPLVFVAHLAGGANWVMSNFALQAEVPDALRGRVFATDMMIATLAVALSQLVAGLFVDRVEPQVVVAVSGAVTLVYGVVWRTVTTFVMARRDTAPLAS